MSDDNFGQHDPLAIIVEFLEKSNNDALASQVIQVFAQNSYNIEQFNLCSKLFLDVRDIPNAEKYALQVLSMCENEEQRYNARANLAKMYNNINRPKDSLKYTNINRKINNSPDSLLETVFSYYLLGQKDMARDILDDMKEPEYWNKLEQRHRDIIDFNLGTYKLEEGHFIEGLKGFMLKGQTLKLWFSHRELPYKFWNGGIFPGKTLILFAEGGGIGDEMLSIRFLDDLKTVGFHPIYYTSRQDMYDLFNRCGYETVMSVDNIPVSDDVMWTYFMQVPIYLNSTVESVKRSKYLYPSEEARKKWSHIKNVTGLKVGVRWQGNAKNERDLHRQVPLDGIMKTLHHTFGTRDVKFFSLQVGDGADQVENYPELIDHTDNIKSYDDTLAILENMDYVVSSCTSVLHASAIVGTKTMGLIPISAYFTWVSPSPNNTSVWYDDNLRIFKQTIPGSWQEPFDEMKAYILKDLKK